MAKNTQKKAAEKGGPAGSGPSGLLRITARRHGFRRAGRAWSAQSTEVDASEFTPEQLAALKAEPQLIVEELAPAAPAAGSAGEGAPTE